MYPPDDLKELAMLPIAKSPNNFVIDNELMLNWDGGVGDTWYQILYQAPGSSKWMLLYDGPNTKCLIPFGTWQIKGKAYANQPPDYGPVQSNTGSNVEIPTTNPITHNNSYPCQFKFIITLFAWKPATGFNYFQIFDTHGEDWQLIYEGTQPNCPGYPAPWILMGKNYATQPPDYGPVQSVTVSNV